MDGNPLIKRRTEILTAQERGTKVKTRQQGFTQCGWPINATQFVCNTESFQPNSCATWKEFFFLSLSRGLLEHGTPIRLQSHIFILRPSTRPLAQWIDSLIRHSSFWFAPCSLIPPKINSVKMHHDWHVRNGFASPRTVLVL